MPSHPAHRLQRQANLQGIHIIVVIKVLKLCAIQASCVKSFHLFIFSLKCSPLSWHPSLKRQPHTYILLTSRSLHTSCHTARQPNLSLAIIIKKTSVRTMPFTPCRAVRPHAQPHVNIRIHSPSRQQGNISHTHIVSLVTFVPHTPPPSVPHSSQDVPRTSQHKRHYSSFH